ncbi:hypothetical protein [Micromonospora sp. KC213]|uniref:hypothetical protein n=1 Tax=Micromonospora sp. KC213 TaxID=2530378 RepID=UPI00140467EF|nr:hypothetical protein [Micromonospora sp. KC213]
MTRISSPAAKAETHLVADLLNCVREARFPVTSLVIGNALAGLQRSEFGET